jgi:AraC-like DNA-binding protein
MDVQTMVPDFTRQRLRIDASSSEGESEWFHEVFRRGVLKVDLEPYDNTPFAFETTIRVLPDLTVSSTFCSPMVSRRRKQATADDALFLALVRSGEATLLYDGAETPMPDGAGTYARYDTGDADAALGMRTGTTILGLRLSRRLIEPLVADYENLKRQVLPAGIEAVRLLAAYLDMLDSRESISTVEAQRVVVNHIHDLAALAIGASREGGELAAAGGVRAARLAAIKKDALYNLANPNLSIAMVAGRQGVTPRYVHMLFEADGITFSEFVIGQRLVRAHRMLSDPRFARQTISAIALRVGFGDLSYFNRTFRRRFGTSPSDVRAAARSGR